MTDKHKENPVDAGQEKFKYVVEARDADTPIKSLIRQKFDFSRRLLTRIKYANGVYLNGEPVQGWVTPAEGDIITIRLPEEAGRFPDEDIPVTPLYEDDDLLLINKQPGIICHPTKGHVAWTLAGGITKYMHEHGQEYKIRFINRLDMDTSGVLAVAKNSHGQDSLIRQMQSDKVTKKYVALLRGIIEEDSGVIDLPIGKPDPEKVQRGVTEDGSPSITHYKVLERFPGQRGHTLTELELKTGRTHQIRVHMAHIGHPVAGDELYGGGEPWLIERQALHASYLSFYHPVTGEFIQCSTELPRDMEQAIKTLRK